MEDFVVTRGARSIENAEELHTVSIYEAHKSVSSTKKHEKNENFAIKQTSQHDDTKNTSASDRKAQEKAEQEKEMKKFRYDVIKFGMSGFDKKNVHQAKIALAISLGAKPPKNKRKNYKKLIEERKLEKIQQKKREKFASGFNSSQLLMKFRKDAKANIKKKSNKKSSGGILDVYGKVTKNKANNNKKRK